MGLTVPGRRTAHSPRHPCACEMLELGMADSLVADWIGDNLTEIRRTCGRPDPGRIAAVTLARPVSGEAMTGGRPAGQGAPPSPPGATSLLLLIDDGRGRTRTYDLTDVNRAL